MSIRILPYLIITYFLMFGLASIAAAESASKPNILFILADDVGVEALGCYGGTSYETPRLDSLSKSGMRFNHCHVMPVCHPTRVALLSGHYPYQLDNPKWGSYPKEEETATFPNALKKSGYATAIAGKWQLALLKEDLDQPHRMGFNDYCLFGWHEGARFHSPLIYQNGELREGLEDAYGPEVYTDFLIDFMKKSKEEVKPFFAYYSMAVCHNVTNDLDDPVPFAPHGKWDDFAQLADVMDRMVGKMVDAVEDLGLADNTLIIFLADNGTTRNSLVDYQNDDYVYEPVVSRMGGREIPGGKGSTTDWGTHVPLIVRWNGRVEAGSISDALVDTVDFFPTFLGAAGADSQGIPSYHGKSLLPVLKGKTDQGRDWIFVQRRRGFFVRTVDWKLYNDGRLFNMQTDPEEEHPIQLGEDDSKDASETRKELQTVIDKLGPEV